MSSAAKGYPLRVHSRRDADLSRWLWLVKWLLALPHYVMLVLLWLAFVLLTIPAGIAILATGRYPARIFSFNVGVLRWSWRVHHYAYGALGTDRYPPFTLADVADYPARLELDRPARLSRRLVLVKWWLLALPHYLIVALFLGGLGIAVLGDFGPLPWVSGGLISLLVLAAGAVLALTGTYPAPLYDVAVGLDRWVLRVAAYAGLMTDAYPPFRLDPGGAEPESGQPALAPQEPAAVAVPPAAWSAGAQPAEAAGRGGWTGGRIASAVAGGATSLLALGLLAAGGAMLWADQTQREDGLLTAPQRHYVTDTRAVISENIDLPDLDLAGVGPDSLLGEVQLTVRAQGTGPVFVGVAHPDDVANYLDGVAHAVARNLNDPRPPQTQGGGRVPEPPAQATFWVASDTGTGERSLRWDPGDGRWVIVVMNADAGAGLEFDLDAGAEVPGLVWVAGGALGLGGALTIVGILLLVIPAVGAAHQGAPLHSPPPQPISSAGG